jgi:hypothetical protein
MEEEIKEMKKLIKIYNNFILFAPILKEPLLLFIAIANITMLILETRTENGILWLFLALFLCGLMIFFYTFWNWNYNILFLGKVGIVHHYFEMNKKYFSKKDMKKIYLKEFLEKEGLEGLPLDSEDVMKFLEWWINGKEELLQFIN